MHPAINPESSRYRVSSAPQDAWRGTGAGLARLISPAPAHRARKAPRLDRKAALRAFVRQVAAEASREHAAWVLDNLRLIYSAERDSRDFVSELHKSPVALGPSGAEEPRVRILAREFLNAASDRFREEDLTAFLEGYLDTGLLTMSEVWALKPALQIEILDRLCAAPPGEWPELVASLRGIGETIWRDLFEHVNTVDRVLEQDPVGAYARMDFESRDLYRRIVSSLAERSSCTETAIAEAAIALSRAAAAESDGSRFASRRAHVGFYLIDKGLPRLEAAVGYRPPAASWLTRALLRFPAPFYLVSIELLTLITAWLMLGTLDELTPMFAAFVLLLLPATQAAVDFVNNFVTSVVPPRVLPKLDFSGGIPADCATMVAVPTLLLNEAQVHDLVLDLEIRYLANQDPNLYFALLTDVPDSDRPVDERDALVDVCRRLIESANKRYRTDGHSPFFMLHRHRAYNESEERWMGWERKRGKLLDLNELLRGGFDVFPVKVGDASVFPRVRYVMTLDSDTQLPRESAAKLIGAIAHPLNQAVVDPATRMVVEGYGIIQPRIGVSIQSASRSRLAALYSGQTGFDIYTRAVSDVYQDLFGQGTFTGKGIYDVDALRETLAKRFPENALLSHDLIEGAYARAALASDIELIDDYPSHFSAYSRRKHRWVRGDWQVMRWVLSQVPDDYGRIIPNPISLISRWKIVDNLRRSLLEPALLLLFIGGWLYLPGPSWYWTLATLVLLSVPVYSGLLFALIRPPRDRRVFTVWVRETAKTFWRDTIVALLSVTFLLHQALLSLDAILRSLQRVFITRRKLLEWETAAEAEVAARRKATVDVYLDWTPRIAAAIAAAVWVVRPASLPFAAPVLFLWLISRAVSNWVNRRPTVRACKLNPDDVQFLRNQAEAMYRFFHDWSLPSTNWLIPDSVTEDGEADLRLSPTNAGMLLNTRVAAVHLGLTTLADFARDTLETLDRIVALPKCRGHLYNWYDVSSLRPLAPLFVSTVDSGNLVACLWTLKQAASAFAAEPRSKRGLTEALAEDLRRIASTCDTLVREMDFRFLYQPRKRALSVGYHVAQRKLDPGRYDLLASEARIACFVAIAKGDIPQEAWFRLGRAHTQVFGERALLSWTGTMFEYFMPAIWMRHYPSTILDRTLAGALSIQREYARRRGVPWGISESACAPGGENGTYAPFGVPDLALKRDGLAAMVIAPYSSFLAAAADPGEAVKNLHRLEEFGWLGRYGFYEAIDYTRHGAVVIRSWMAHHQGMALLSLVNLLLDNPMQEYFHREPGVMATELVLHERLPASAVPDPDPFAVPESLPQHA